MEHGRRSDNHQKTRARLIEAAFELFLAQGYDATTVDEIAARAGVSRRTLFRYFPSKERLALADDPVQLARFRGNLRRRVEGERPFDTVRRALMAVARDFMDNDEAVVAGHRIIEASPSLVAADRMGDLAWEEAIAEALLDRVPAGEANERWARIAAGAIFGAIRVTLREWFATDGEGDLIAWGKETMDVVEAGISCPPE